MKGASFDRFASTSAYAAAVGGILYGFSFVILFVGGRAPKPGLTLSSILLLIGGLLSSVVLLAIYQRVRDVSPSFALWGLGIGVLGALGSSVHAGYDLANVLHAPLPDILADAGYPNQVDPRGLLTFGFAGVSLFVFAWLIGQGAALPKNLSPLGYLLAVLLVVIYLGRLIILDPTNTIVRIALAAGVIVNTIWFVRLGGALGKPATAM